MKKNNFFKNVLLTVTLSQWVLSPMAQASELNNVRKAQMNQVLAELGYNTKQRRYTVDEIWTTTKYLFNEKDRDYLDRWVAYNGDQLMPKVDVNEEKDKSGDLQYRWTVQGSEGLVSITFLGEDEKFLKINDKVFSKMEVFQQIPVVVGLADQKFSKKAEARLNDIVKVSAPRLMTSDWMKMTPEQRAEYLIEVRKTLMSSAEVLEGSGKKTAQMYLRKFDLWLGEIVSAANAGAPREEGMCVVAGYVGKYMSGPHVTSDGTKVTSGLHCSVTHAMTIDSSGAMAVANEEDIRKYENNKKEIYSPSREMFGAYNSKCSKGFVSCNPYVFGMDRSSGGPLCIEMSGQAFSVATKSCDEKSPLANEADTKAMIQSMLKAGDKDETLKQFLKCKEKCKISSADVDKLKKDIIEPFNKYIEGALTVCRADGKKFDRNQGSACETLEKRKGTLTSYVDKIIADGQKENPPQTAPANPVASPTQQSGKPPASSSDSKPTQQGNKPGGFSVADNSSPAGVGAQAGSRVNKPEAKAGLCTEYKFACVGGILFVSVLAGLAMLKAQAKSLNITTPTYVPPVVNGCPTHWIQTGSTSQTCYPPNYNTGTTSTPVAPPAPLTTTPTTPGTSTGTR